MEGVASGHPLGVHGVREHSAHVAHESSERSPYPYGGRSRVSSRS
ncbi:hypothetical protein XACM_3323 [Xanthomonas euvesicatoria pv. citrumelo F1]|nr:hypothetical protein XACM_3323 [Xanthomonas euvesicatoria pv. citrumelo F1]